jgi:hypothetical protein
VGHQAALAADEVHDVLLGVRAGITHGHQGLKADAAHALRGEHPLVIADALAAANVPGLTWAFVNLLGCIPLDSQGIDKVDRPPDECVRACAPRLTECFALFKPKLVVCLGNDAADWLNGKRGHGGPVAPDVPRVKTVHPAAILRAGGGAVAYQLRRQSVATLATAIRTHCGPMTWRSDDANAPF